MEVGNAGGVMHSSFAKLSRWFELQLRSANFYPRAAFTRSRDAERDQGEIAITRLSISEYKQRFKSMTTLCCEFTTSPVISWERTKLMLVYNTEANKSIKQETRTKMYLN
jgi:hypothetical protein